MSGTHTTRRTSGCGVYFQTYLPRGKRNGDHPWCVRVAAEHAVGERREALIVAVSGDRVGSLAGIERDALAGRPSRHAAAGNRDEEAAGVAGGVSVSPLGVGRL